MDLLDKKRIPFLKLILFGFWPSFIKVWALKIQGQDIGRNVKIGLGSILVAENIKIEDNVKIAPFTIIMSMELKIRESVTIGSFSYFDIKDIFIGKKTRIRESVLIGGNRSPQSKLIIGSNCLILQNVLLNTTDSIEIGDNTAIGGGSKLFTHSSWLSILEGYPVIQGPINIGSNVWLPYDTTILANVNIGDHVVITPRTVVNQNIPEFSIAGGQPLKISKNFYCRNLSSAKREKILDSLIDDLTEILKFDNFMKKEETEDISVYTKRGKKIILVRNLTGNGFNNYAEYRTSLKNVVVFIASNIKQKDIHQMNVPMVYFSDNKPEVKNSNELTELLLTFLSRYGIR